MSERYAQPRRSGVGVDLQEKLPVGGARFEEFAARVLVAGLVSTVDPVVDALAFESHVSLDGLGMSAATMDRLAIQ